MIKTIPLNKLVQSPRNVRKHADAEADAQLKASIAANGLLQNLIVRPAAKGKFEECAAANNQRYSQSARQQVQRMSDLLQVEAAKKKAAQQGG